MSTAIGPAIIVGLNREDRTVMVQMGTFPSAVQLTVGMDGALALALARDLIRMVVILEGDTKTPPAPVTKDGG